MLLLSMTHSVSRFFFVVGSTFGSLPGWSYFYLLSLLVFTVKMKGKEETDSDWAFDLVTLIATF